MAGVQRRKDVFSADVDFGEKTLVCWEFGGVEAPAVYDEDLGVESFGDDICDGCCAVALQHQLGQLLFDLDETLQGIRFRCGQVFRCR